MTINKICLLSKKCKRFELLTECVNRAEECFEEKAASPQTDQAEASSLSELLSALIDAWVKKAELKGSKSVEKGNRGLHLMSTLRRGEGMTYSICAEQLSDVIKSI